MATRNMRARKEDPVRPGEPDRRRDEPDQGREDEGPGKEERPGRPSPPTDDPVVPDGSGGRIPLISAWAEEERDPPSQRPSDAHEDRPRRRKAS